MGWIGIDSNCEEENGTGHFSGSFRGRPRHRSVEASPEWRPSFTPHGSRFLPL